jgi:hypothetical protein
MILWEEIGTTLSLNRENGLCSLRFSPVEIDTSRYGRKGIK